MKTIILNSEISEINKAAETIKAGGLVAFPTETVYGLGADAQDSQAVAKIYATKMRPSINPLIVHFSTIDQIKEHVCWNQWSDLLAKKFWPGPMTLILKRNKRSNLSRLVSAGLDTVAVRVPDNEIAQKFLELSGCPIAAPSANMSGKISPTTVKHVLRTLNGKIPFILDGGLCKIGLESTVIDVTRERPAELRPGGITSEEILTVIGSLSKARVEDPLKSPGMLQRHYSPDTNIRLNATYFYEKENILGFGPTAPNRAFNLSLSEDLVEAAANLFDFIHQLDQPGAKPIAVMPIPKIGLGVAINDRLNRAASKG